MKQSLCQGCGQKMQDQDPGRSDFVMSLDFDLCMRCFRWRNYKDLPLLIKPIISTHQSTTLDLPAHDHLMLVIDCFFIKETLVPLLGWLDQDTPIIICATKKDLLPKQITDQQIKDNILRWIPTSYKKRVTIHVCSTSIRTSIERIRTYLQALPNNSRVVLLGMINAGKSSLINALLNEPALTISPYPQTTLDPIIKQLNEVWLIDTPGLSNPSHLFYHFDPKTYQRMIPKRTIKPIIYQLIGKQSILIDDLIAIHVESMAKVSVSIYVSEQCFITRKKTTDDLMEDIEKQPHVIIQLKAEPQGLDFLIESIGRVHAVGSFNKITVTHHPKITISKSKGMIIW